MVVMLIGLGALAAAVQRDEVNALDRYASPFLHGLASPGVDAVMFSASLIGSNIVLIPLAVASVAVLAYRRLRRAALWVATAAFGSIALNELLKNLVERPRPKLAWSTVLPDYSFPSGHTMNSTATFLALALVVWQLGGRRVGIVAVGGAVALAILIGTSRVYFGFHYATDVLGGYLAGALWLVVVGLSFDVGPRFYAWRRGPGGRVVDAGPQP
jgi:undecaprenyl-diphosphatase